MLTLPTISLSLRSPHSPIGINPRALHCFRKISPSLEKEAIARSKIISAWTIFGRGNQVAKVDSNIVYGTSRGEINLMLYRFAVEHYSNLIDVRFNMKLVTMDFASRELVFQTADATSGEKVQRTVDAKDGRVIGCDGVYSMVRKSMVAASGGGIKVSITPWTNEFRVLFAPPGKTSPDLDETVHYIFDGCYAATVDNEGQQQWSLVLGARDSASDAERCLLLGSSSSPSSVASLKKYVKAKAPRLYPLLEDAEYERYFSRRTYRGAIVDTTSLVTGEWCALIGDAAHALLPAAGEGINAALEDCALLADEFEQGKDEGAAFERYNEKRLPAARAIAEYARYLNGKPSMPGEFGARLMQRIVDSIFFPKSTIDQYLFGPRGKERLPYDQIVGQWRNRRQIMLPFCRLVVYPFAWTFYLVSLPFTLLNGVFGKQRTMKVDKYTLKPPVGDAVSVDKDTI